MIVIEIYKSTFLPWRPFEYVLLTYFNFLWLKFSVGEATAGKASRSLAQHIPGPGSIEGMKGAAGGVMGELTRARIALDERGQRLGELEEKTAGMMTSAEAFSKHAHEVTAHGNAGAFTVPTLETSQSCRRQPGQRYHVT